MPTPSKARFHFRAAKKIAVLGSNDTTKLAAAAGHLSLLDVVLDIFVSARL